MNLSLIEIIQKLIEQGHEVEYTHRKDGGYIIRKIDTQRFSGKSGNAFARRMVGTTLSHARQVQLAKIRLPKGRKATKLEPIPEDIKKALRRVQREWRKKHPDIEGTMTTRGVRYHLRHYGEEETLASLDKGYRYASGYAYIDNVMHLVDVLQMALDKDYDSDMEQVIDLIKSKMLEFKEEWIYPCYEAYYEWTKHSITAQECARRIKAIIS